MKTTQYKRAAGLYYSRDEAQDAVQALKDAGYDVEHKEGDREGYLPKKQPTECKGKL